MPAFKCPQCEEKFRVPEQLVGATLRCPHCKKVSKAPRRRKPEDASAGSTSAGSGKAGIPPTSATTATSDDEAAPQISISSGEATTSSVARRRSRHLPLGVIAICGVVLVSAIVGGIFLLRKRKPPQQPQLRLAKISSPNVKEFSKLEIPLAVDDAKTWQGRIRFRLVAGPDGLTVSEQGKLEWKPGEEQGPGEHEITVEVETTDQTAEKASLTFKIAVTEHNQAPRIEPLNAAQAQVGQPFKLQVQAKDPDSPPVALRYFLEGDHPTAAVNPTSGEFTWTPRTQDLNQIRTFKIRVKEDSLLGLATEVAIVVRVQAAQPPKVAKKPPTPKTSPTAPVAKTKSPVAKKATPGPRKVVKKAPTPKSLPKSNSAAFDYPAEVAKRYREKNLFRKNDYVSLRQLEATRVWRQHEPALRLGMSDTAFNSFKRWLDANPGFRDEFLIAVSEKDDIVRAAQILVQLRDKFPKQILTYGNLAIATALVWDNPRSVYDYSRHQRRAKSTLPSDAANGVDNFGYLLETERFMQGRGQWLPWEFLVHVVNHRTPHNERQWALQNYVGKRSMFGRCYKDVPYDFEMLNSQSRVAKMNDKVYNLPNLKSFGGVCAHQADYASRVGKSIGVPAAYVRGPSKSGGYHAWVMWVELKKVTQRSIVFTLESFGRYNVDKYYVGTLLEPQTGQRITDRQLELRLQNVGVDARSKRHADLLMQAYAALQKLQKLDTSARFRYISQVIKMCPGNQAAWTELADMAKETVVRDKHRKQMKGILEQLFVTFAGFPDFTWTIFDKLVEFEPRLQDRIKLYQKLLVLYQRKKRPDLVCQAGLRLATYMENVGQKGHAIDGLAGLIRSFSDEGRYVPRMLDRMEVLCKDVPGAGPKLLAFYHKFLPTIPTKRGNRPSTYCIAMHERGIKKFREAGQNQLVKHYETQLAKIRSGQSRGKK